MRTLSILFTILFSILFTMPATAQLGNLLKDRIKQRAEQKAKQRVEQELNKKVDETVEEALDEVFKDRSKSGDEKVSNKEASSEKADMDSEEAAQRAAIEAMMGGEDDSIDTPFIPLETTGAMTMTMNNYTNGKLAKDNPITIRMTFDRNRVGMHMSQGGKPFSIMIHKLEEKKIVVINNIDGKPQAMEMSSKLFMRGARGKKAKDMVGDMDIKKTGNRKTVQGYDCEEYIITSEDGVTTSWVTQDAPISSEDMQMMFAKGFNMGEMFEGQDWKDFTGLAIESTSVFNKGKDRTEMTISDISTKIDNSIFDVSKYDVQKLPGF